jgi:hypothetical protein
VRRYLSAGEAANGDNHFVVMEVFLVLNFWRNEGYDWTR